MKSLFLKDSMLKRATLLGGLACLITFACSCGSIGSNSAAQETGPTTRSDAKTDANVRVPDDPSSEVRIEFDGVKLKSQIRGVSRIEPSLEKASVLEEPTDKPDMVWSSHVVLKLEGDYAARHRKSFFEPRVRIFPIEEFRTALSRSESYVKNFDEKIRRLQRILEQKPLVLTRVPRIPFFDGSPELIVGAKRVSFRGGQGVVYVTQFNIEPSLINNDGLTYVFQGLTSDRKYYILATFPLSLDFLPKSYRAREYDGYERPQVFFDPAAKNSHAVKYRQYLSSIKLKIESTSPNEFQPSLSSIEDTISSLEVALE